MTTSTEPVEVRVADVRRYTEEGEQQPRHVVGLEEVGGNRLLLIWVGPPEAIAIAAQLEKVEPPRPPTYMFMASLLEAAGAKVREVRITRLAEEVFYGEAVIEGTSGTRPVDARPSDAIILALATGAPIRADPAVLDAAAVVPGERAPAEGRAKAEEKFGKVFSDEGAQGAREIVSQLMAEWRAYRQRPAT